jgi:predicted dehydrogenase
MLKQEQFDIACAPDHWHALAMIAAVKAGADIFVEKPISVDVVEGQAMLAAARKYKRVVQVNMERRSTPHLIEAIERVIKPGKLGKIAHAEICCFYHMRAGSNPPDTTPPEYLDYEMWTGPAPMRPYCSLNHPRSLAGLHGVRQRHRRRYVRAHARHGPLDARPGLAEIR